MTLKKMNVNLRNYSMNGPLKTSKRVKNLVPVFVVSYIYHNDKLCIEVRHLKVFFVRILKINEI